jgi:hypothetical protein
MISTPASGRIVASRRQCQPQQPPISRISAPLGHPGQKTVDLVVRYRDGMVVGDGGQIVIVFLCGHPLTQFSLDILI